MTDITNYETTSPTAGSAFKVANLSAGSHRMDVSREWFSRPHDQRFLNLNDLRDYTKRRYDASETLRLRNRDIEFVAPEARTMEDTQKLSVGLPNGSEVVPTHWSFGQTATLAKAPAAYLRTLPSQIAADALTWGMRQNREIEEVKAYYQPDGTTQLHAMTGPDYGRIPDYEVVEAVQQIAGAGTGDCDWKIPGTMDWRTHIYDPNVPVTKDRTTLFASDRDVFMFLVDDRRPIEIGKLPNGDADLVFRGFYAKQSEMGSSALVIATMYLRAICDNRILWGVEGFEEMSIRHSKYAPDRFIQSAVPALQSYAEGSVKRLQEGVEMAKAAKIASDDEEALEWLRKRGFPRKRAAEIAEAVEVEEQRKLRTIWDVTQGITAVARKIPHQDERLSLEREAGKILQKIKVAA